MRQFHDKFFGAMMCATAFIMPARTSAAETSVTGSLDRDVVESQRTISGPFISRPDVMTALDQVSADGNCAESGRLVFGCLIQSLAAVDSREPIAGPQSNPFNLKVATVIRQTIEQDLTSFRTSEGITPEQQLHPAFLTHPASRVELVGIVNRIDRQFNHDIVPGAENHARCGEISVIYRFSYSLHNGDVTSRLPVTMNVVFPAIPRARPVGAKTCSEVAARWLLEMRRPKERTVENIVADLNNERSGIVSLLNGADIERIELNIQAYRISAGADTSDLGSTAEYVIRVFRWSPEQKRFVVSYLTNQIDRARILGNTKGDENSCNPSIDKIISKTKFIQYLSDPAVVSEIDTGTLNIPQAYLACRATSVSPGGPHRSKNLPFWNAPYSEEQVITDRQLSEILKKLNNSTHRLNFVKSVDDMRMRLNDMTCTGCHQTRAIAGFHFPGADRLGTASANAVLLPGSPQFYGDQIRRTIILERLANGERLSRYDLATNYSARPSDKFSEQLKNTELIGGWGGACTISPNDMEDQRKWRCKAGLECVELIKSRNTPGLGTCVPRGERQIGDALQTGLVTTSQFGSETYLRIKPNPVGDWTDRQNRDTRIPLSALPQNPPKDNSYHGSHQEFYQGIKLDSDPSCKNATDRKKCFEDRRDALTGGFPAGSLELSECINLPAKATCALIASSGFNACLAQVSSNAKTLAQCFAERTSYAGMRACDAASPCRDDYICLKPIGYNLSNGHEKFVERQKVTSINYDIDDFGQKEPDYAWISRNNGTGDQRGICIPPYFVFQFRSDGHPSPMVMERKFEH